jgi:hypothetical protein
MPKGRVLHPVEGISNYRSSYNYHKENDENYTHIKI